MPPHKREEQLAHFLRLLLLRSVSNPFHQMAAQHLRTRTVLHALQLAGLLMGPPVALSRDEGGWHIDGISGATVSAIHLSGSVTQQVGSFAGSRAARDLSGKGLIDSASAPARAMHVRAPERAWPSARQRPAACRREAIRASGQSVRGLRGLARQRLWAQQLLPSASP